MDNFFYYVCFEIGDGTFAGFFGTTDGVDNYLYPNLFACSVVREALRSLTVNSFLDHIYSKVPGAEGGDRLQWHLNWSGKLDVRSFYKAVRGTKSSSFPWKSIWCVKASKRVSFILSTTWSKILT